MFFDDEKEIIKDDSDIQITEDGVVAWDDILDTSDDDDLVPISDEDKAEDEIELANNLSDEVDDDELMTILNSPSSNNIKEDSSDVQGQENTQDTEEENFDLDKQLENINIEADSGNGDFKIPEKKIAKKGSFPIFLIAILFGILTAGGAYYAWDYFSNQDVAEGDLQRNKTVDQEMNEVTKEDIAQRAENADESQNIPIVDEDSANELQPEEKEPEEKKEVITIIPTGRDNPFLPIQKYQKIEIPETIVRYDKANIIKPPKEYGVENPATTKMLSISVSGIMYDAKKPSAVITFENNDYFVQRGDKLDDYRVVDIGKNFVTVALGNNIYKASVGEEFKLTDFYGNAKYLTDRYDGGRQYQTVGSEEKYASAGSKVHHGQYVSEDEIEINTK